MEWLFYELQMKKEKRSGCSFNFQRENKHFIFFYTAWQNQGAAVVEWLE